MGINYSIDTETRIVRLEYVRESTVDEFTATMRAIFRSPSYRPGFGFLADRRNVDVPTRDYVDHVVAFMVLFRESLVAARWAVVIGSSAGHGMGRMGQTVTDGAPMRVQAFQHIEDAERWLGETAPKT